MTRIYSSEAELYDIAFGWELAPEADWLVERLGPDCRTVLEPGCGTGRMLAALAERGLEPGARYLVQQGLAGDLAELWRSEWDAERDDVRLHIVWEALGRDAAGERSRSRVEFLGGPREGEVVEDLHTSSWWTPETWSAAVAASPLVQAACYGGAFPDRPAVELTSSGLLWHELVVP